jgi:hypothetical protein
VIWQCAAVLRRRYGRSKLFHPGQIRVVEHLSGVPEEVTCRKAPTELTWWLVGVNVSIDETKHLGIRQTVETLVPQTFDGIGNLEDGR